MVTGCYAVKLKSKWPFILSLFSLLALACYCLLAWLFMHRYDLLFDEGFIIRSNLCGRSMLHFIWWGAGLAGWFFIRSTDSASCVARAYIWGVCQFSSAWGLAYPAAFLGRMNDGFGIMLILFAPLVTLPSFVVACILGKARSGSQSSHLRSRLFSCLVILVFITTALSSFLYEENRERHTPPRLEQMEMGENPIQAQKQA